MFGIKVTSGNYHNHLCEGASEKRQDNNPYYHYHWYPDLLKPGLCLPSPHCSLPQPLSTSKEEPQSTASLHFNTVRTNSSSNSSRHSTSEEISTAIFKLWSENFKNFLGENRPCECQSEFLNDNHVAHQDSTLKVNKAVCSRTSATQVWKVRPCNNVNFNKSSSCEFSAGTVNGVAATGASKATALSLNANSAPFQTQESTNIEENGYIFTIEKKYVETDQFYIECNGYSANVVRAEASFHCYCNLDRELYFKSNNLSVCVYRGIYVSAYYHKEKNIISGNSRENIEPKLALQNKINCQSQEKTKNSIMKTNGDWYQYSNLKRIFKMSREKSMRSLATFLSVILLAASVGVRGSEFPDRECCDSVPPPPPHYHSATSTTTSTPPPHHYRFNSSIGTKLGEFMIYSKHSVPHRNKEIQIIHSSRGYIQNLQ